MKKRAISLLLCMALSLCFLPACGASGGLQVYDRHGKLLIRAEAVTDLFADDRGAYLDIVLMEATEAVMTAQGCTQMEAETRLFGGYEVYTAFEPEAFLAMQKGLKDAQHRSAACAMTDISGNLVAVYSVDPQENRATALTSPYSSIKPLSVYAPALEAGIIRWNTTFPDTPYKELETSNGTLEGWPSNATGGYSNLEVPVSEGVRGSYNTVAVKCLAELGVEESVTFLQEKLGMDLTPEAFVLENMGAEEIIGNIALGYLERGVSAVDMAGWYQIFANDGSYIPPAAVQKICDAKGNEIYTRQVEKTQIISPATAQTVNLLLQGVVSRGGTGAAAACRNVDVAGKTGTGDDYSGNWFVGVTPSYSCAVWHGKAEENRAAAIFKEIMEIFYNSPEAGRRSFPEFTQVTRAQFCTDSGMIAGKGCSVIETGYLPATEALSTCDKH